MWVYNNTPRPDELYHYGVLGMKWGVRRYQNYDGSYTRKGLQRYDASMAKYNKAVERYKTAKRNYISNKTNDNKVEITQARLAKKQAKTRLNKDYKHLKRDKMSDKGKELYSKGVTITGNSKTTGYLTTIGGFTLSAAIYNQKNNPGAISRLLNSAGINISDDDLNKLLLTTGGISTGLAGAKSIRDHSRNKKLRAYYSHTSKY